MVTDFDFLIGNWRVVNTRLQDWLCDCTKWVEFESEHHERKLQKGNGNIAFHHYSDNGLLVERSVIRSYDKHYDFWNINRIDLWTGLSMPSLKGTFWQNKGCFLTKGLFKNVEVLVWVEWTRICKTYACWEQALSSDNGKKWETNWQMEFFKK